ncbi:ferredoxin [Anaerovorax odorimutans]|uniref:ferredoxin n=1 Tax=Anaerovorax odorimutans TaxID=109327 RepID=UPI000402629B|nr:ferredoxin [Anaerovorax odorimutans]
MKAIIDESGCIGCGICVNTCPQVFQLGENGLAQVINDKISSDLENVVEDAKNECPVSVISIK